MKKTLLCLGLLLSLTACGQEEAVEPITRAVESNASQQAANQAQQAPTTGIVPEVGAYYRNAEFTTLDNAVVDYNFKEMSATVAYSQSLMMMYEPQDYWGKTMRIDGSYMCMNTPEFGDVHVLLILDETNCCQGFVEFYLPEGSTYPASGDPMGVVGTFILVDDPQGDYSILEVYQYEF